MNPHNATACGKPYPVILTDPPWKYGDKQANRSDTYPRMALRDLIRMDAGQLAAKDAAMFMWATAPLMSEAIRLLEAWGFTYKTIAFTWIKMTKEGNPSMGMGHYTRSNAEFCLLGTRGKALRRESKSVHSVVLEPRREHSRKPDCVRDRIVELFGDVPRMEMFARGSVPDGWCSHGNEAEHCCTTAKELQE